MRVNTGHISLQFSDNDTQTTADIEAIFDYAVAERMAWITGTEAGPGSGNTAAELIRVADEKGYLIWVPSAQASGRLSNNKYASHTDCWIAVRSDLVDGDFDTDYIHAIDGSTKLKREGRKIPDGSRWGPKGLVTVAFDNYWIGRVNIGAAHYLTKAHNPGSSNWDLNQKIADVIGDWARSVAAGKEALAFYGGDQNMVDLRNAQPEGDTFFGNPLTSAWDRVSFWENTGHGNIDVIANYDHDRRVRAVSIRALQDAELPLNTDHFFVEAVYVIEDLPPKTD